VTWTGYLAVALLLLLPLAVLTVRAGAVQQGLLLYALCCLAATALLALFVVLMLLPGFAPWRPAIMKRALLTLPGAFLLAMLVRGGDQYPPIHDISTDLSDPPQFRSATQQRGPGSNSLDIKPDTIAAQRESYPQLQTLLSDLPIDTVYDRALQVASDMGWDIYYQDRDQGVIEAVDTTAIMAFRDDVIVRVRSNASGTLLDLRSVSRVGVGDLGANAKRIREFQRQFEALGEFQP
jgi:uncharacterized protein (DUF1499 family)